MPKFFVLSHHYNDERSWWEPYFGERLGEADNIEAMIASLSYDGLYRVFEVGEEATVQISTEKVTRRDVQKGES